MYRIGATDRHINLFARRTGDAQALAIAPRLVAVESEATQARIAKAWEQQSAELPEIILIASDLTLNALAARLDLRLDVNADGIEMFLLLWDARIFQALADVLSPPTRQVLFNFGARALVADRCGGYAEIALSGTGPDTLQQPPLRLSQQEVDGLMERSTPDTLLGMLREQAPAVLEQVHHAQRHTLAFEQWRACVKRGLLAAPDQALALTLAIEHGADWWEAPQWSACVQAAQQGSLLAAYAEHLGSSQ